MKKLPRGFTAPLDNNHLPVYHEPPDTRPRPCGRNSAVECQLPKLDVAGSNPVARFCEKPLAGWRCPTTNSFGRTKSSPTLRGMGLIDRTLRTLYPTLAA